MSLTTVFEFEGLNEILTVSASADSVDNYEAENLRIKFMNENGDRIFPDLNRDMMDEIVNQAIEELNEMQELEF